MTIVTVRNRGHNSTEAAGRVFPPRRPVTIDVAPDQVDEIDAHPRLEVDLADVGELTVAQLRDVARDRGLKVSGTKDELVARITSADADDGNEGDDGGD